MKRNFKESTLFRVLSLLVLFLLFAAVGTYGVFRSYLHSESFRVLLSKRLGEAIHLNVWFGEFQWDGLAVKIERFLGTGQNAIRSLHAEKIQMDFGLGGLRRGSWEVKNAQISKLQVELDLRQMPKASAPVFSDARDEALMLPSEASLSANSSQVIPEFTAKTPKEQRAFSALLPRQVEFRSIRIEDFSLLAQMERGDWTLKEMSGHFHLSEGEKSYRGELSGGVISSSYAWLPEIRMDHVKGIFRDQSGWVKEAKFQVGTSGLMQFSGEWNQDWQDYSFEGELTSVRCDEIFNEDWAKKLTGHFSTTFLVKKSFGQSSIHGELHLKEGRLTALPILDGLALWTKTRRFRELALSEMKASWSYVGDTLVFRDIVIVSEELVRLEGSLSVRGEAIEGDFRLGFPPAILRLIPKAQANLFEQGEKDLLWTPLRISGTLDHVKEDLSKRLVLAAGLELLKNFSSGNETADKSADSDKLMEEASKALDGKEDLIKDAERMLKELFKK